MASYSTLALFPRSVPHGTGSAILSLPLATMHRWYWQVRRWQAVLTMGAQTSTTIYERVLADETGLLFDGPLAGISTVTSDPETLYGATFDAFSANVVYNPGTASYLWNAATGFFTSTAGDSTFESLEFPVPAASVGADAVAVNVPITVDGVSGSIPGRYYLTKADGSQGGASDVPTISYVITPVAFWEWDGTFDPTTGAKL